MHLSTFADVCLDFFRLLLSNCLNWKIYCDDHSSLCLTLADRSNANTTCEYHRLYQASLVSQDIEISDKTNTGRQTFGSLVVGTFS